MIWFWFYCTLDLFRNRLTDRSSASSNRSGAAAVSCKSSDTKTGRRAGCPGDNRADREASTVSGLQKSSLSYREACACTC